MKLTILAVCAFVAVAIAAPPAKSKPTKPESPQIVRSDYQRSPDGGYYTSFETEDGTVREEVGEVKEVRNEEGELLRILVIRGSYSYFDNEGNRQSITYVADEDGYRAEGDSIPKVPEARR